MHKTRQLILQIRETIKDEERLRYLDEEIEFFDSQGDAFWESITSNPVDKSNPNNILILGLLGRAKKPEELKHKYLMSDPPDIDCDFESDGREKVIDYLKDKYGEKRVLHIGTIGTIKIKSAIIDISRVLSIDPSDVYAVTTSMEDVDESATLEELKESHPKLEAFLKEYPEIENHLYKILGSFRHYCLGGDSTILCNLPFEGTMGNNDKMIKISELVDLQNDFKGKPYLVYVDSKGETRETDRYEVIRVGEAEVFELELEDGRKVWCNEDHTWFTNQGLKKLKDFDETTEIEALW